MKQTEFEALVARLEERARSDPKGYRVRVFLLAMLGYGYIGLVVLLVLGLLAALAWAIVNIRSGALLMVKVAIPLASLIYIAARAMWVRLDPPTGRPLTRAEAPLLFEEAERIARALKAPVPDVVLVTSELNASVSQVPRLGIFGWRRNYLVIGLQLMSALHPDYFRAVLAHEFAHLSRAHGHFSGWIYRLRMTWIQLLRMLERDDHVGRVIFSPFFGWYAPYFAAYSFVLARAYEYEADQLAASISGHRDMAGALLVLAIKHREIDEEYWRKVWSAAETVPQPPPAAISDSLACAAGRPDAERVGYWAYAALQERTDTSDTHPSLNERVTALLASEPVLPDEAPWVRMLRIAFDRPTPPEDPPVRAAPLYLGPHIETLATGMDVEWRHAAAESWRERHAYCQRAKAQLAELDQRAAVGSLSPDDSWQRAELTTEFCGTAVSEPLYRELLERVPDHAGARFASGNIMLHRGDAAGISEVERAMDLNPEFVLPGTHVVTNYLALSGRNGEAATYRARMLARHEELADAMQERALITPRTEFAPSTLDAEVTARMIEQVSRHPDVTRVWIVRQVVTAMPERPAHVLALSLDGSGLSDKAQEVRGNTITESLSLPENVNAFVLVEQHAAIRKKLERVDGALAYRREAPARALRPSPARASPS